MRYPVKKGTQEGSDMTVLVPWWRKRTPDECVPYPRYGKNEIFCGPHLPDAQVGMRRYVRTGGPEFHMEEVLRKLGAEARTIDLFVAYLEGRKTLFPRGLSALCCPKVAKLGDTFHGLNPLSSLLAYLETEKYDCILAGAQPAHLHFFCELDVPQAAVFPRSGPSWKIPEQPIERDIDVLYVGARFSQDHVRRTRMLYALEKAAPGICRFCYHPHTSHSEWLSVLARARMTVCCSLNNQFTPQIYNIMRTGSLCLVEELSPQSGLYHFFKPGTHLATWRDTDDLLAKIRHYTECPGEAERIARQGRARAEECFPKRGPEGDVIRGYLAGDDLPHPGFTAGSDRRCGRLKSDSSRERLIRVCLYENIQELHRTLEVCRVLIWGVPDVKTAADLADLPRLRLTCVARDSAEQSAWKTELREYGVGNVQVLEPRNMGEAETDFDVAVVGADTGEAKQSGYRQVERRLNRRCVVWVLGNLTRSAAQWWRGTGFRRVQGSDRLRYDARRVYGRLLTGLYPFGIYVYPCALDPMNTQVPGLTAFVRRGGAVSFGALAGSGAARNWWRGPVFR